MWKGKDGAIKAIMNTLKLPHGSYGVIHKVLDSVWCHHLMDMEYTGDSWQVGCKPHHQPMIQPGSVEEQIVADAVEDNLGFTGTMHLVNSHIKAVDASATHVGRSSIKTVVDRLRPNVCPITAAPQSANITAESPLGMARYEQFQQHRLRLGRVKLQDLCAEDQQRPAFLNLEDHNYSIEQVSWWDEMHPSCRIGGRAPGPQAKIQRQFLRDINTGKLVQDVDGINGDYATRQRWGKVKYNKEIRLSLGCCLFRDERGVLHGRRLPVWDYTNKWVVTITQYEQECIPQQLNKIREGGSKRRWVEGTRTVDEGMYDEDPVNKIRGIGKKARALLARMGIKTVRQFSRLRSSRIATLTKKRGITRAKVKTWLEAARSAHVGAYQPHVIDHRRAANPYESLYGDDWQTHIRKDVRTAGSVCITELIEHMDAETAAIYKGTKFEDSYFWYHDALSQLTCKRTREWLVEKDLLKRWLIPVGECNVGTCYFGRPCGNTPEVMCWDCSLNHDVHSTVEFYSSLCRWVPKDHPLYLQRFGKASTKVMRESYLRVLDPVTGVCPSSKRIVQDITKCWGKHLDLICGVRGAAVKDLGNRVGKRKLEGVKKRGGKRVKKDWKMLDDLHPDIVDVWKLFIDRSCKRHGGGHS